MSCIRASAPDLTVEQLREKARDCRDQAAAPRMAGPMAEGLLLVLAEMFEEKAEQKEAGEDRYQAT